MTDLGIKRKDMYPSESQPVKEKDLENEVCYPKISADGKQAELMGADDLTDGDVVEVPMKLRVDRVVKTEENGKKTYSLTFCVLSMGDMVDSKDDSGDSKDSSDTGSEDSMSPAEAVLTSYDDSSDE